MNRLRYGIQCLMFAVSLCMCKEPDLVVDENCTDNRSARTATKRDLSPRRHGFYPGYDSRRQVLWKAGIHIHNPDTVFQLQDRT